MAGDSTAVGVGASAPERSLAGLIGQQQPAWEIRNVARTGARFADIAGQLGSAEPGYDAVLILAGGNDVIQLTGRDALRSQIEEVLALARSRGQRVVLMPCGNVGHAPFFLPPVSWWMSQRSQALHADASAIARAAGVNYVSLLLPRDQDPFVADAARMHADDGLHPSDDGYRQWYRTLVQQSGLPLDPAAGAPGPATATRGAETINR